MIAAFQQQLAPPPVLPDSFDPWRYWPSETISKITQAPLTAVGEYWPLVALELERRGVTSRENWAAAIGTIAIETASTFAPVREAYWLSEAWRRNNLRYYPWYGRGFIQLTWEYNYQAAGDRIGVDLISDPDRAMAPTAAAAIFAWYWALARPSIPPAADRRDWPEVRRQVQGGSDGLERLVTIAEQLLAI